MQNVTDKEALRVAVKWLDNIAGALGAGDIPVLPLAFFADMRIIHEVLNPTPNDCKVDRKEA